MADRAPVDVILPCLAEAEALLAGPLDQGSASWWPAVVPDDDSGHRAAESRTDPEPYGPDQTDGGPRVGGP